NAYSGRAVRRPRPRRPRPPRRRRPHARPRLHVSKPIFHHALAGMEAYARTADARQATSAIAHLRWVCAPAAAPAQPHHARNAIRGARVVPEAAAMAGTDQ